MPEYKRKLRNLNYYSSRCKEYLRIDFGYQCAYCKTHESESISGEKLYEKDHFKPQDLFKDDSTLHKYDNLFYSCNICNGKSGKSNKWSSDLLNPCEDDIYGENLHVVYPKDNTDDFKLNFNTTKGELFINTFNLNQYDHRQIRKKRWELHRRQNELKSLIKEIEDSVKRLDGCNNMKATIDFLIDKINNLKSEFEEIKNPFLITEDLGHTIFKNQLSAFGELNHINEDYNLDYEFICEGSSIKCTLLKDKSVKFIDGKKMKKINVSDAKVWKKKEGRISAFLVDLTYKKVYHCDIKKALENIQIDNTKQTCTIWIEENNEINEHSIKKIV